jgi:hypothetical protein
MVWPGRPLAGNEKSWTAGVRLRCACRMVGARGIARDHRPSGHDAARRAAGAVRVAAERVTRLQSRAS